MMKDEEKKIYPLTVTKKKPLQPGPAKGRVVPTALTAEGWARREKNRPRQK